MPNWCDNTVTLSHQDKSKVDALVAVLENKNDQCVFNHLRPNPKGEWEYEWSVDNWGTKWDIRVIDWERNSDNEVWISFDTAWSPPTTLYEYIATQGWDVDAVYCESGMAYCGIFNNEGGDQYYEYDLSDPDSIEQLPEDCVEFGDLKSRAHDYMLDMLEENWSDKERTEWFSMDVKPAYNGYYELNVKGYEDSTYTHFVKYDGDWEYWSVENLIGWRGLTENYDA